MACMRAVLLAAVAAVAAGTPSLSLSNTHMSINFVTAGNTFVVGELAAAAANVVVAPGAGRPLWSLLVVNATHNMTVTPTTTTCTLSTENVNATAGTLVWSACAVPGGASTTLTVRLHVTLPHDASFASLQLRVDKDTAAAALSLWSAGVALAGVTAAADDELFFPSGFGVAATDPLASLGSHGVSGSYPSSNAAMTFMSLGGGAGTNGYAAYVASHDASAAMKSLYAEPYAGTARAADADGRLPECGDVHATAASQPALPTGVSHVAAQHEPLARLRCRPAGRMHTRVPPGATPQSFSLGVSMIVHGAGAPGFSSWSSPLYAMAVSGPGAPAWYPASQLYRQWALTAPWTARGPLAHRSDAAKWLQTNNAWVNSGWQCYDRFNTTQGDPAVVLPRMLAIRQRFNTSLALHWYEWQQGPDPSPAARYRFDTHYPSYFPARSGFDEAQANLSAAGVASFPYINGRIFDVHSPAYLKNNGITHVTMKATSAVLGTPDLVPYEESYGSGATFQVAAPNDGYWQNTTGDVVAKLQASGSRGVYIDQIGAAGPTPDWAPSRGNAGGGGWWVDGEHGIIHAVRRGVTATFPVVTESNAEPYMDVMNGYLTLVAFSPPGAPFSGGLYVAPAFAAVYGGYYMAFGATFTQSDFAPNPDVLCSRLALQLVYGAQLGWFSMGGVTHGPDVDKSCGPMGTFELFMSAAHDAEVAFLQQLTAARAALLPFVADGRLLLPLAPSPPFPSFMSPTNTHGTGPYAGIASAVWRNASGTQAAAVFAVPVSSLATTSYTMELSLSAYGLPATATCHTVVASSAAVAATCATSGDVLKMSVALAPRSVLAVTLQ